MYHGDLTLDILIADCRLNYSVQKVLFTICAFLGNEYEPLILHLGIPKIGALS